jgi:hypothetical protein
MLMLDGTPFQAPAATNQLSRNMPETSGSVFSSSYGFSSLVHRGYLAVQKATVEADLVRD